MTDEQINIAIAEACGWTCLGQVEGCKPHGYPPDARKPTTKELLEGYGPSPWDVPDYCNDLNAMHEAVRKLTDSQRAEFRRNLTKVWTTWYNATRGLFPNHDDSVNAPADQRAEAFLRTLNLWKI